MGANHGGAQRGIGKFEFLVLIAMLGVLATVLLDRLRHIEEEAERVEISLAVRNMRVGLALAVGERIMQGREETLPELLAANPLDFLGRVPSDYFAQPGAAAASKSWQIDRATGTVIYHPRQPTAFDGRTELCWKIAAQHLPGGRVVGIGLENLPLCATLR